MEIWRYPGPKSCDLVYKSQLPNPLYNTYFTRGNFLLENYGGCVVMLTSDKVAIYLVDWLKSGEACFEVQVPVSTPLLEKGTSHPLRIPAGRGRFNYTPRQ